MAPKRASSDRRLTRWSARATRSWSDPATKSTGPRWNRFRRPGAYEASQARGPLSCPTDDLRGRARRPEVLLAGSRPARSRHSWPSIRFASAGRSSAIRRRSSGVRPPLRRGPKRRSQNLPSSGSATKGSRFLRLGLLPFYQIEESGFAESVLLKKAFQWLYRNGDRWIYSFRGHADFKHRYRGTLSKVYFATYTRWRNAINLVALMRLCRFI